jgi:spermidine synthase
METNEKWFFDRLAPCRQFGHLIEGEIYKGKTAFQEVQILKSRAFGKILTLDGDLQSTQFDEYIYHETLVHPAMFACSSPEKVLIIGGGEGATLREVLKHRSVRHAVMVDLDRELIKICKDYLPEWSKNAFHDKRVTQVFQDAKEYLLNTEETFDVIISDLVEPLPDSPARFLVTKEFYELIKSKLSDKGIFVMQASMAGARDNFLHSVFYRTLSSVYSRVFSLGVFIPSYCNRWGFIIASDDMSLSFSGEDLQRKIEERIEGELSFYDCEAHREIFSLIKPLRLAIEKQTGIFTESDTTLLSEPHRFV